MQIRKLTLVCSLLLALALPVTVHAQSPEPPYTVAATDFCPPLAPSSGNEVNVSTVNELVTSVNQASPGDVILLADGVYNLDGAYLRIDVNNVTLRSASGDREAVILDGNYATTEIFQIVASDVTIADITLREAYNHPIHVSSTETADTLNTLIYNVHIIDPGEQAIKINPYAGTGVLHFTDNGTIACSHIELTDSGRTHIRNDCYTGGVDAHQSRDWVIRDNVIEGFWCASGLSEHAIHMWNACRGTLVERNRLNNNARGVGFGMAENLSGKRTYPDNPCPGIDGYVDHYEGIVRNNFLFANDNDLFASNSGFDCGICLWQACEAEVYHNTLFTANPGETFSSIEWRFDRTTATIRNNLLNATMRDRGGSATLDGNLENAPLSWFVDSSSGDLHLVEIASDALDQVTAPANVPTDIDGDTRPIGTLADVGADEYGVAAPAAVNDLHITQVIHGSNSLTVTLRWTPPASAVTTIIRWADNPITEDNWPGSTVIIDTLSGNVVEYTAVVPYTGDTIYFALKTAGVGGESPISNLAFWPTRAIYLPLVMRQ